MSTKIYLPIDGNVTSKEFLDMLNRMEVSADAVGAASKYISEAVIGAQVGKGLSQFQGITQVPVDAAPQTVASATSTDRGASIA